MEIELKWKKVTGLIHLSFKFARKQVTLKHKGMLAGIQSEAEIANCQEHLWQKQTKT